jgi:hypothetical protein
VLQAVADEVGQVWPLGLMSACAGSRWPRYDFARGMAQNIAITSTARLNNQNSSVGREFMEIVSPINGAVTL